MVKYVCFLVIAKLQDMLVELFLFLCVVYVGDGSHSWIAAGAEPDAHQFMS
jgi:hypothetical protein